MSFDQKVVWITGASSGIGKALAIEFAKNNAHLVISSRRVDELKKVCDECLQYGKVCHIVQLDVASSESIQEAYKKTMELTGGIDVLINNAGLSQRSQTFETPVDIDRKIMEINYFGQVELTKLVLPQMIERKSGHIAAVSSITGKFGFPLRSAYAASKHAISGFYESLYLENKRNNIQVSIIFPGRIKTNISLSALEKDGTAHGKMDPGQEKGIPADKCARIIIRGMKKSKVEIFPGGSEIIMVRLKQFFPKVFRFLASKINPT